MRDLEAAAAEVRRRRLQAKAKRLQAKAKRLHPAAVPPPDRSGPHGPTAVLAPQSVAPAPMPLRAEEEPTFIRLSLRERLKRKRAAEAAA